MSDASEEVLSVAELDRRLKRAVELGSAGVWVEGEVASFKPASSGHVYFTLKDERDDAVIECVMYKFEAARARRILADGARIQLRGKATVWAPRGRLQFVGDRARPAGRGALLEALEQLRLKLDAEGLFSAEHKRELPSDPRVVGVVTSKAGAAFSDIRTVAFRRGSVRLVLANARVQGEGAAESILRAIDALERYPELDVLIVGRGGGSGEDLMAFNDERVVRRVAKIKVPVVSAVGHEIDLTLTDLAADVRAATPSQAAELVVPDERQRRDRLSRCRLELGRGLRARLSLAQSRLYKLDGAIADPRFLIAERQQELDELSDRLNRRLQRSLAAQASILSGHERRLIGRHPRAVIARTKVELRLLAVRLEGEARRGLAQRGAELGETVAQLDALSPLAVLSRGYAIATTSDGRAVRDAGTLGPGDAVTVRVARGRFEAEVTQALPDAGGEERSVSLRFVLLGHPVAHSMSPAIHHAAYHALGLPHRYELVDAASEAEVAVAVEALRRGEIAGANVTIPWKRVALRLADAADASASEIGAANVLVKSAERGIIAYNTDVLALRDELALLVPSPRRIVVIGSGGAALAAVASARGLGAEVGVVARRFRPDASGSLPDSEEMTRLGARALPWPENDPAGSFHDYVQKAELVVQATSAGMHGADGGDTVAELVPWPLLPAHAAAYDLVYNPPLTPFLERARAAGRRAAGGLGMLVGQARAAIELWLGAAPPREPLLEAAQRALQARNG